MNLAINSDNSNRSISQKSKSWRIGLRAGIYSYIVQAFLLLFFLLVVTPFLNEISFEPIAVDNFRVDNPQLSQVACQALNSNEPIYFVTDEILSESIEPVETFTSANGVYVYANVYDALEFAQSQQLDCQDDI